MPTRALDTHYNGYKFRSRLEARWAVFFDAAGVEYLYESEGFDVGGGVWYLPDFFLKQGIRFLGEEEPRQDTWVEIKPTPEITEDERQKIARFVRETGKNILLIAGDPGIGVDIRFIQRTDDKGLDAPEVAFLELADGHVGLVAEREREKLESSEDWALVGQRMQTDLLVKAYKVARESRFDRRMKRCERCRREFQPKHEHYFLCYSCYRQEGVSSNRDSAVYRNVRGKRLSADERLLAGLPPRTRRIVAAVLILVAIGMIGWSGYQLVTWPDRMFSEARELREQQIAQPTEAPSLPATFTPMPTVAVTMEAIAPTGGGAGSGCLCTENLYDCTDFESQDEAQACFDSCRPLAGDVHELDRDEDGSICEGLP